MRRKNSFLANRRAAVSFPLHQVRCISLGMTVLAGVCFRFKRTVALLSDGRLHRVVDG